MYEYVIADIERKIEFLIVSPAAAHEKGYLGRTSLWGGMLANMMGCTKKEEELEKIIGWLHDVSRVPERGHMKRSADAAIIILAPYNISSEDTKAIYDGIADHEFKSWGKYRVGDGVALADKICEASGAYICFRHALYKAGVSGVAGGKALLGSISNDARQRIQMYNAEYYPSKFRKFALSQQAWQEEYASCLERNDAWAVRLTESMYSAGKRKQNLEYAIQSYEPAYEQDELFKEEAVKYINGEKLKEFQDLIF